MSVTVVRDPRFLAHDPGPYHPESPARLRAVEAALQGSDVEMHELHAEPATLDQVALAHSEEYVRQLESIAGQDIDLDPDTHASPGSFDAAILAAGAAVQLASGVVRGVHPPGLALVRPPGHHATRDRAMGFCLINNVAVAARALVQEGLAERVAIYDFDVHHGNGTEAIFYDDPNVLYMSTHQWPFYPGTGAASDTGRGAGEGATLNVPLPAGTGDAMLLQVTDEVLAPKVRAFRPDVILLSAGFDPFIDDPIGGFEITKEGFARLSQKWRSLAAELCDQRILGVLEGGYDLDGLGACVSSVLDAWSQPLEA